MEQSAQQIWNQCLNIIKDNINRQSFKTWFAPLKPLKVEYEETQIKLTIQLPSRFYYEWLEEHYYPLLRKTVVHVLGPTGRLFYDIVIEKDRPEDNHEGATMKLPSKPSPEKQAPANPTFEEPPQTPETYSDKDTPFSFPLRKHDPPPVQSHFIIPGIKKMQVDSQLNVNYVFERFIEGDCNSLARSAAWAIATNPGRTTFNPFLVYGGVGLGKTHLIQAIGNYAKMHNNVNSVLYVSSERFTSEFVQSIQHHRVAEFSMFYRQIDLLIVDDIQFFSGKEKTQEEFFHTFNTLHQAGKQIILSSDKPPVEIEGIEERLLSRFQWGLQADVKPPDLETRIAILQRKAEDEGMNVSTDVIEYIAHNITSNIRELEGALIRLMAHAMLHNKDVDLFFAKDILRDLVKEVKFTLSIEKIQSIVCEYFDIPEDLVRAKTRKQEVVQARQVAMYFSKKLTKHSLKTIGLHFGGRDHSTVIHAIQSVEDYLDTDPKFRDIINEIQRKIDLKSR